MLPLQSSLRVWPLGKDHAAIIIVAIAESELSASATLLTLSLPGTRMSPTEAVVL
jgi:hypothetical protein